MHTPLLQTHLSLLLSPSPPLSTPSSPLVMEFAVRPLALRQRRWNTTQHNSADWFVEQTSGEARGTGRKLGVAAAETSGKAGVLGRWSLHGKPTLVIGGTRGIGRAVLEELAALGASVHTCSQKEAELGERLKEWEAKFFRVSASPSPSATSPCGTSVSTCSATSPTASAASSTSS